MHINMGILNINILIRKTVKEPRSGYRKKVKKVKLNNEKKSGGLSDHQFLKSGGPAEKSGGLGPQDHR